jgi:hypothetical protein
MSMSDATKIVIGTISGSVLVAFVLLGTVIL